MHIRLEHVSDRLGIYELTKAAFKEMPFSDQREAAIIDALREQQALSLSLVAVEDDILLGHVAFSPVTINGENVHWYGLGPVSVWPDYQKKGIGQALIREGLKQLKDRGARGCVLVGDPKYYGRFGFKRDPSLTYSQVPAEYFQRLIFIPPAPKGEVQYHPAFQ